MPAPLDRQLNIATVAPQVLEQLGLGNVDNTSDEEKVVSGPIAEALGQKITVGDLPTLPSRAYAISTFRPVSAPDFIVTAGYAAPGDRGGALYKKVASEPTHPGKLSITLLLGGTVHYEFSGDHVNLFQLGAKGDSTPGTSGSGTDDTTAFNNAKAVAVALRIPLRVPRIGSNKAFRLTAKIDFLLETTIIGDGADVTSGLSLNYPDGGAWLYFDHLDHGLNFRDDANVGVSKKFSRVKGIGFVRNQAAPGPGWAPSAALHDIRVEYNVDLDDVVFLNPSKAVLVRAAGQLNTDRLRGQPLIVGIECERSSDVQRWNGDHWWPYWTQDANVKNYTIANAVAYSIRRADGLMITNPFSIFYKRLFYAADFNGDGSGLANFHIVNPYADVGGGGIEIVSNYYAAYGTISGYHCNSSIDGAPSEGAAFRLSGSVASQIQLLGFRCNRAPEEIIYVSGSAHTVKVLPGRFNGWSFVTSSRFMIRATDGASIQFTADPEYTTGNSLYFSYDATSKIELPNGCVTKTLTISNGVITVPGRGVFNIDTEGGAATDDLVTINGGKQGEIITLFTVSSARDVIIKHATGNLFLGADFTMATNVYSATFVNVADVQWRRISTAAN